MYVALKPPAIKKFYKQSKSPTDNEKKKKKFFEGKSTAQIRGIVQRGKEKGNDLFLKINSLWVQKIK